jgi:hypothetical protein
LVRDGWGGSLSVARRLDRLRGSVLVRGQKTTNTGDRGYRCQRYHGKLSALRYTSGLLVGSKVLGLRFGILHDLLPLL